MMIFIFVLLSIIWIVISILSFRFLDGASIWDEYGDPEGFGFYRAPLYVRIPIVLLSPLGLIMFERDLFLPQGWNKYVNKLKEAADKDEI